MTDRKSLIEFAKIGAPITDADMAALSASEVACYRWPGQSDASIMLREAFMEGAADEARRRESSITIDLKVADLKEVKALMEESADLIDRMREGLQQIVSWSEAYPLQVFPEPDLKKVRALLMAGGISLDSVSAHAMRAVVSGVGQIARKALGDA